MSEAETNPIFFDRIAGFEAYFKSRGQTLTPDVIKVMPPDKLSEELCHFLDNNPAVEGIFVPASRVRQVREACAAASAKKFIGYDLTSGNLESLQKGEVDFLIYQRPELQGYKAIQLLYKCLILGQEVPAVHFMPIDIIAQENVAYVDFFSGFRV